MKKYIIKFNKEAFDALLKFHKSIRTRINNKLIFFANSKDPFLYAKKIIGSENNYRFRIGDYRIIFTKQSNNEIIILLIIKVAHRRDVYE